MNLAAISAQVGQIAREVGQWMLAERAQFDPGKIEFKGLNDLVSYVDREAEERLIAGLKEILPDALYVTEEGTISKSNGLTDPGGGTYWIIDPLDGTTNFIHGLPIYAVSIGLLVDGELVQGCVYEPNRDELFLAHTGGGTTMNGREVKVTSINTIGGALLATGFPYAQFEYMQEYLDTLENMMQGSHGLRRLGSAAIDLAYTACGRFEGFFEYNLKAWDVAGGIVLVREAGGTVTDFKGGPNCLFGGELIAAGPSHGEMLGVISGYWK